MLVKQFEDGKQHLKLREEVSQSPVQPTDWGAVLEEIARIPWVVPANVRVGTPHPSPSMNKLQKGKE